MFKILILIAVGFILFKLLTNDKKKKVKDTSKQHEKMAADGIMVKDPVCGTYVDKQSDIRVKHDHQVHCFCSYDCRDKYLKKIGAEHKAHESDEQT